MPTDRLDIAAKEEEGLLTLTQVPGISGVVAIELAKYFGTLREIVEAGPKVQKAVRDAPVSLRESSTLENAHDSARRIQDDSGEADISCVPYFNDGYPELLRLTETPPAILHVRGTLRSNCRNIACVGNRNSTQYGDTVAERITKKLAENDWNIVSGLAVGIDTVCHKAAIEKQQHTTAVLAHGLDRVYPNENTLLAQQILDSGGALVSEHPIRTHPQRSFFIDRNRIQSGISAGTFLMQSALKGGSMHTARFTLMQGRALMVPIPTGDQVNSIQNKGVLALGTLTAEQLIEKIHTDDQYQELLRRLFSNDAPAIGIHGRDDYPQLLEELNELERDLALLTGGEL